MDDLNYHIKLLRDKSDEIRLEYIHRYKYQSEYGNLSKNKNNVKQIEQFKVGDEVMYFVGDRSIRCKQWYERFSGPWNVLEVYKNGIVRIENKEMGENFLVSTRLLKLYKNSSDWIQELDYEKLRKAKQLFEDRNEKKVEFK